MIEIAATNVTTVKFTLEVDFIPWACISRGQYNNIDKYTMITCTADQDDWLTKPWNRVNSCANSSDQAVGDRLKSCAGPGANGNSCMEETIGAYNAINSWHNIILYILSYSLAPMVVINGVVNTAAVDDLKTQVCLAIPKTNRPIDCANVTDPVPVKLPVIIVQVYYSPLSQRFIDFMALNSEGNDENRIMIEFIPWGRANKTRVNNKTQYLCPQGDNDCMTIRLHACIAKNHQDHLKQHEQFLIIQCISQNTTMTDPLAKVAYCVSKTTSIDIDNKTYITCAGNDSADGNAYMNKMFGATSQLYPLITEATEPIVLINGKRNVKAVTDLRTEVCNTFPMENMLDSCKLAQEAKGCSTVAPGHKFNAKPSAGATVYVSMFTIISIIT
ncbi:unnamed protein product, partial [Medioppia subpectinata]